MEAKIFDLEKRTNAFSKNIINFIKQIPTTVITTPLISQLIRSATSIGANYTEANHAISKADFRNKVFIARKEASETLYWLDLIEHTDVHLTKSTTMLKKEAEELVRIFSTICKSCSQ